MITIGNKQLCEYCLEENGGEPCRFCGYDKTKHEVQWSALPPGSILSGKYIVGKIIGKGGFGITYLAYDLKNEKKIALKEYYPVSYAARGKDGVTVSASRSEDEDTYKSGMEKFYNEASLVSTFNGNPNIVSVYEFFYENETAYFVMEFLRGCTLKAYIEEHGVLSPEQTLYIADKVSSALMVVHSANTLHRDVSPDNIMLCEDGKVKLLDFGAARQIAADNPKSMSVILKQGFAPLEQYQKRGKHGPWTDLYSLGATLYYSLTEECLDDPMTRFDDDSEFQTNINKIEPQLRELISHALNLKIEGRYQDALEFRADMNKIPIKHEPINIGQDEPEQPTESVQPAQPVPQDQIISQTENVQPEPAEPAQSVPQEQEIPRTENVQPEPAEPAQPVEPAQSVPQVQIIPQTENVQPEPAEPAQPVPQEQEIPRTENVQPEPAQPVLQEQEIPRTENVQPELAEPAQSVPQEQEIPRTENVQPEPEKKKLKKKVIAIPAIVLASLAVIGVAVYLLFFRGKGAQMITIGGKTFSSTDKYVDLSNMYLHNEDIEDLRYFTKLKRVNLDGNSLSDLSVLAEIPTLEEIDASDNYIKDISFLKDLKKIKIVVMNDNRISDISVFQEFTTIEKIWLCDNTISDISYIAGNKKLVELGFGNCPLYGDIEALRGMNKIEMLNLERCGLTDISVLSTCTSLKKLYIGYNNIEDYSPINGFDLEEFYG